MPLEFILETPANFRLDTTVRGHGWYDLAPFSWVDGQLSYVFRSGSMKKVAVGRIRQSGSALTIRMERSCISQEKVERDIRHILRLDEDLSEFYEIAASVEGARWVSRLGAGRLLRSASVYEDMVKTLCTTNCSWALTRKMVENLVDKLGEPAGRGMKAFPTPEAMASVDEGFYRNEIKAGYRSPFFLELAKRVVAGELDAESYLTSSLTTHELKEELKKIKGFGDYAADNLLKLLGRNDGLALDSWLRARFYQKHNKGKACSDKKINKHYSKYGRWQGLMIWCDMTEDWFHDIEQTTEQPEASKSTQ